MPNITAPPNPSIPSTSASASLIYIFYFLFSYGALSIFSNSLFFNRFWLPKKIFLFTLNWWHTHYSASVPSSQNSFPNCYSWALSASFTASFHTFQFIFNWNLFTFKSNEFLSKIKKGNLQILCTQKPCLFNQNSYSLIGFYKVKSFLFMNTINSIHKRFYSIYIWYIFLKRDYMKSQTTSFSKRRFIH